MMYHKTHKFGNMTYHKDGHYSTKVEAENAAEMHRRSGLLARVVGYKHGYCVFTHSKE
jgi:hypothetical protein